MLAECTCKMVEAVTTQPVVAQGVWSWSSFAAGVVAGMAVVLFIGAVAMTTDTD